MKQSFVLLSIVTFALGRCLVDSVPQCASSCITGAITAVTKCDINDSKCHCSVSNYQSIYTAALSCVMQSCGADITLGEVAPATENFCVSMGKPPFQVSPDVVFKAPQNQAPFIAAVPPPPPPMALPIKPHHPPVPDSAALADIRRRNLLLRKQAATNTVQTVQPVAYTSYSLTPLPSNVGNPQNSGKSGSFFAVVIAVMVVGI